MPFTVCSICYSQYIEHMVYNSMSSFITVREKFPPFIN